MNSYNCCMCKRTFTGTPAWKNAAGDFCPECRAEVMKRMAEGNRNRVRNSPGGCIWCGRPLHEVRYHGKDRESVNTCADCETHRAWLLKCIRVSDRPAKYVARVEEREAEGRKEREIRAAAKPVQLPLQPQPTESEARLARVEKMLNTLMVQLGV